MRYCFFLIIFMPVLFLIGCSPRVYEVNTAVPKNVNTALQVRTASIMALSMLDWQYQELYPGLIEASKKSKSKLVTIYVVYGYAGYSIDYVNSENMKYNHQKGRIDSGYNRWVDQLDKTIIKMLKNGEENSITYSGLQ